LLGAYVLLHAFDSRYGAYLVHFDSTLWELIAVLSLGSLAVALLLRGKSRRTSEGSLSEELVSCVGFLGALYAFRGLGRSTPLLLTLALAAMLGWITLLSWRLLRRSDLAWKGWRLKSGGRLSRAGAALSAAALCAGAATAAAVWTQVRTSADWNLRRLDAQAALSEGTRAALERALELDPQLLEARKLLAGRLYEERELPRSLEQCEIYLESAPRDADAHVLAALSAAGLGQPALARGHLQRALAIRPGMDVAEQLLEALEKP
jgi:tetratricopeptide (TPR) repeat protein